MANDYSSDIKLGEKYTDIQTGYTGIATAITFFQYACERISLETYDPDRREVKTEIFDAPRLMDYQTGVQATTERTGGPQMPNAQAGPASR